MHRPATLMARPLGRAELDMSVSQEQSDAPEAEQGASTEEVLGELAESIRTLDFSQPTKFTTELRRRIVRALD
jgi:hypothetical protein